MEGEDCVEVADAKACRRSRSNSKEVVNKASDEDKLDGSQDVAEKLVNSNDNVVANGAENDSVKEEGEEHEEEEDAVEEEEEEEDEEEEEEPSPAMEPCSEKEEGKIEKNGGNEHVEEEEEEEKESPCEEAVESDGSSEKWQLNIDTSGSSLASEQGASDAEEHATAAVKEEVESEPTPVQGESAPVQGESAPVQGESTPVQGDTCEPSSEETEPFIGFEDACSSEVSSILKKLIEKYEMNGFPSDDDDLSSDSEDSKTETAMFMDEVGKDGSDVATDIEKAGVSQKDAADVHSSVDIQGKVDGGWKRELVYRNTADSTSKRMADIYYYTPTGKKVRSNREVVENLVDDELTLENFTFFKEPLGLNDPTKEVIRDAKRVAQKEPTGTPPKKVQKVSPKVQKDSQSQNKPVVVIIKDSSMSSPKEGPSPDTTPKQSKPSRTFPRIKVTPLRNQRPSLGSKPASNKLKREPEDGELEMGMLPPMWKDPSHMNLTKKAALLGTSGSPKSAFVPCGSKNTLSKNSSSNAAWSNTTKENLQEGRIGRYDSERQFMQFFMMNLGAGYSALGQVFQYLKVQELLRAARVCRLWHDLAGQASLWRTVRMKNSQVVDWKGCADSLRRYGTEHLDLRKMLVQGKPNVMWDEFCSVVGSISSLRQLDLCKCTVPVIERIAQECPQLQSISALSIKCSSISLQFVNNLKNLQELRLKGLNGMSLNSKLDVLQNLPQLKHLTLTTFRELGRAGPTAIGSLSNLESLELGEFGDFPDSFGSCLVHLKKLQRLRLEKGQGKTCPTLSVLTGVRTMPCLVQLELINFDIKPGFDSALARCTNIRRLLIIPTYVTQSATTNHMVLGGVTRLSGSLDHFVWGVTHELLRVTELFVDQCEGHKGARLPGKASKKNGSGDSIPVLRPVPGLVADEPAGEGCDSSSKNETIKEEPSASTQQVDILSISKLTSLLTASLPKTKVKILKIPFNATWRQFLGDHNH